MKNITYLFIIPLLIGLSTPSFAGTPQKKKPAVSAEAVLDKQGAFSFCVINTLYESSNQLSIALSQNGEINIAAKVAAAGFEKGKTYKVSLALDDTPLEEMEVPAIDEETLIFRKGADAAFSEQVNKAKTFSITGGGATILFPLTSFGGVMTKLEKCVKTNTAAPRPKDMQKESSSEKIPSTLEALLKRAALLPIETLSMSDIPKENRPADFIWRKDGIMGGYTEKRRTTPIASDEMIGLYLKGLKAECKGAFHVSLEKEKASKTAQTRLATTECLMSEKETIFDALLFLYRPDDPLFTIITQESSIDAATKTLTTARALQKATLD